MNQENDLELDVITSDPDTEEDAGHSEASEEDKRPEEPDKKEASYQRRIHSNFAGIIRKKRLILSLMVFVGAVVVVSTFFLSRPSFFGKTSPFAGKDVVIPDNFREETLAPFFIPLSQGESGKMAAVDAVALWDDLTSLRFQKKEHRIRNRLYQFLVHFEEGEVDLQEKVASIQSQMSGIVRESLGIEDLTIRVREIKIY
jgi:hypothetical protein